MSRFFDQLRSRLADAFKISAEPVGTLDETRGVTLVAYLPAEDAAIEAVHRAGSLHKISAATAVRIDDPLEVKSCGGFCWRLDMTFYLAESELAELEGGIAGIANALGGRLGETEARFTAAGRKAA